MGERLHVGGCGDVLRRFGGCVLYIIWLDRLSSAEEQSKVIYTDKSCEK